MRCCYRPQSLCDGRNQKTPPPLLCSTGFLATQSISHWLTPPLGNWTRDVAPGNPCDFLSSPMLLLSSPLACTSGEECVKEAGSIMIVPHITPFPAVFKGKARLRNCISYVSAQMIECKAVPECSTGRPSLHPWSDHVCIIFLQC